MLLPVMLLAMAFHFYRYRSFINFDYITYLGTGLIIGIVYTIGKYLIIQNKNK